MERKIDSVRVSTPTSVVETEWVYKASNGVEVLCVVRQNKDPQGKFFAPWRCGYVQLQEGIDQGIVEQFNVHGGITFNARGWIGFDCNHDGDRVRDWHLDAVRAETEQLAEQVAKAVPLVLYFHNQTKE